MIKVAKEKKRHTNRLLVTVTLGVNKAVSG